MATLVNRPSARNLLSRNNMACGEPNFVASCSQQARMLHYFVPNRMQLHFCNPRERSTRHI